MSIVLVGSTSGSITLQEPAVAGTTVLDLPAASGTFLTTGSSGQSIPKAALPTGSVLQVVTAVYSTSATSTGSTPVSTGLSASITPTSSSSKILVLVNQRIFCSPGGSGNNSAVVRLNRNSTIIFDINRYGLTDSSSAGSGDYFTTMYLDSPASTSAISYNTTFYKGGTGGTAYCQLDNNPSTITLLEIAA